jgi:WD40 repeat protein
MWDAKTGTLLTELRGHKGIISCLAFSPDGQLLASGSEDATIKLWPTATWRIK